MGYKETAPDTAEVLPPIVLNTDLETEDLRLWGTEIWREVGTRIYEKAVQATPKPIWLVT